MIQVIFLQKVRKDQIKPPKSFYVDTHNYETAENLARARFSKDPIYSEYGMAICIDVEVIYP